MNQTSLLYHNCFIIILAWSLAVCGIIANIFVLKIAVSYFKRSNAVFIKTSGPPGSINDVTGQASIGGRSFTILITNLAMADLLAALYLLILASADLHYRFIDINTSNNATHNATQIYATWIRHPFCYIARFISFISICQSMGMASIIALDRFTNSVYPFTTYLHLTPRRAKIAASLFWVYSIALGITSNIIALVTLPSESVRHYRYHNICNYDNLRFIIAKSLLILMITTGTIIYIMMVVFYILIVHKIRQVRRINRSRIVTNVEQDIERKVLKMALIIGCTNFITWFPAFIVGVITVIDYNFADNSIVFLNTTITSIFILHSNCVINPIIFLSSTNQKLKLLCCE